MRCRHAEHRCHSTLAGLATTSPRQRGAGRNVLGATNRPFGTSRGPNHASLALYFCTSARLRGSSLPSKASHDNGVRFKCPSTSTRAAPASTASRQSRKPPKTPCASAPSAGGKRSRSCFPRLCFASKAAAGTRRISRPATSATSAKPATASPKTAPRRPRIRQSPNGAESEQKSATDAKAPADDKPRPVASEKAKAPGDRGSPRSGKEPRPEGRGK